MRKPRIIGQGAALCGAVGLILLPALLSARQAQQKQAEKPQVVDMGGYRVSAPPDGKWKVIKDEKANGVNFAQYKEGLLTQMSGQARGTVVSVFYLPVEPFDWLLTEEQVAAAIRDEYVQAEARDPETPGVLAGEGETVFKDKKLRFVKFQETYPGQGQNVDSAIYVYFPPDFRSSHKHFQFHSSFVRPAGGVKLYENPGEGPVEKLIDSLEIVDPLRAVTGPEGDLLRAAVAGNIEAARQAMDKGAKADSSSPGMTALSAAALYGHRDILDLLLGQGADVNKADVEGGRRPLHQALIGGQPEIAEILLNAGAEADPRTKAGFSPLMYAVVLKHAGLVSMLIAQGADVNARNEDGRTALVFAAENGSIEIAKVLAAKNADVNAPMKDGRTALMRAINRKNSDIAGWLLESGAAVNLKTGDGWTALMAAAYYGNIEIARALIEKGADVNAKTKYGMTPLMYAAENAPADIVKLLLEKGADVAAKNSDKQTALKLASRAKRTEIVGLLKAAGAKG